MRARDLALLSICLTSVGASSALAQVTPLGASPPAPAGVLSTFAYDEVNHVYLHVWEYNNGVWARFIGTNGAVLGASFVAAPYRLTFAGKPKLAAGSGKFLLTYVSDAHNSGWGSNIFGQFITYTGSGPSGGGLSGGTIFISPNSGVGTKVQVTADVAYNPLTQRFFVAYDEVFGNDREAMARPFAASDGAALAAPTNLSGGPGWQGATAVACDWERNKYFAVYMGENPAAPGTTGIFARVIDGNTGAMSSNIALALGYMVEPAAAFMPEADGFLAAWTAFNPSRDVMGRFVPSPFTGSLPFPVYGIMTTPWDSEGAASVDYDYLSRSMLVGAMSDTLRIVGSVLDAAGGQPTAPFLLSTVGASGGSFYPTVRAAENAIFGLSYIIDYQWAYHERYQLPLAPTPGPRCCGGAATFVVNPTSWSPPAGGGTQVITVTASDQSAAWTVTSGAAWVTSSAGGGTGNGSVTLTASANPGASPRSTSVTVAGTSVSVTQAGSSGDVTNGTFSNGLAGWLTFAVPSDALVVSVVNGVLEFYRQPAPPGTAGQGVVYQSTATAYGTAAPIAAEFDVGNSSAVRKRLTVLLHDLDFSDLHMCTFWLAPNAPLRTYRIQTHSNRSWANATISFYTATAGSDGGAYRLDNVRVYSTPGQAVDRTDCVDPTTPAPINFPDSSSVLTNGDFSGGLPPWSVFGQMTYRIQGGRFEFYRPAGTPAGVVYQATGLGLPTRTPLTAVMSLGNSSNVRKRVAVLIHDSDFSDLGACTFWLEPGQALGTHTVKLYTTKSWTNAMFSVYPSTIGTESWIRLDNVTLKITPSAPLVGTECIEGAAAFAESPEESAPVVVAPGFLPGVDVPDWKVDVTETGQHLLVWSDPVDLTDASWAFLRFESKRPDSPSAAFVDVTRDGVVWTRVAVVPPSGDWTDVLVDLSAFAGDVIYIRFVHVGVAPVGGAPRESWSVRGVSVESRRLQTPQSRPPRRE